MLLAQEFPVEVALLLAFRKIPLIGSYMELIQLKRLRLRRQTSRREAVAAILRSTP